MKKGKRWLALCVLVLLVLMLMMSAHIWAIQLPDDFRYFYQLVPVGTDNTEYLLYVERTDASGIPLHAGSITLAAPSPLSFEPEGDWVITPPSLSPGIPNPYETGTVDDNHYISFSWYWPDIAQADLPASSGEFANRQLLGTLKAEYTDLEAIELLPWPETTSGAARIAALNAPNADREAQLEIVESVWRMPDTSTPQAGYYQGFYAEERTDTDTEGYQYAVDLTAGWQGFTIGAYAPEKPATILFYQYPEEGEGKPDTVYAVAETTFGDGTGYFKGKVNFSALELKAYDTGDTVSLVSGTYDIVILKPSHVQVSLEGVTYDEANGIFPDLQGLHVEIPCGDLKMDDNATQLAGSLFEQLRGNGVIALQDRSVLQACLNGALTKSDAEYAFADLNGDEVVSLADLDILMSAENYNKQSIIKSFIIEGKEAD